MLYEIVGIDYHKNRAVSTKSFENTLLSAECKKTRGKLWQKERGLDDASPLDMIREKLKKTSAILSYNIRHFCWFMVHYIQSMRIRWR